MKSTMKIAQTNFILGMVKVKVTKFSKGFNKVYDFSDFAKFRKSFIFGVGGTVSQLK